jgi:ribosomal protein L11 methyltransferase
MRMTPLALEREICEKHPALAKQQVRQVLRQMIREGDLLCTNHYNTTHLEINFRRPMSVSDRIMLAPYLPSGADRCGKTLVIVMDDGGSFGLGDHPTTRLCLQAVDRVLGEIQAQNRHGDLQALDIGTGSGILAMAAVGLGAHGALALDIDPLALHEAERNIRLNGMDEKIALSSQPLSATGRRQFGLVMANLRTPTLMTLFPMMAQVSAPEAFWVISGCRKKELDDVIALLSWKKIKVLWQAESCGWGAVTAQCKMGG